MQLHIYKDAGELSDELAKWIFTIIEKTLAIKDRFTIALSGGNTPATLYKKLADTPYREKIPWTKLHFFWGDERVVPFNDERNNARMAFETFLNKVAVPAGQIHVMQTGIPLQDSVAAYELLLHEYFDGEDTSFDLVLLGMGEDGHTLSLFPWSPLLNEQRRWVNAVPAEAPNLSRITLMPAVVNRAAIIAFLVSGSDKAKTLEQVLKGKYLPEKFPAQLIHPVSNQLHWFVDEAAASELVK
jgi:6-phosphogluconolactonase